jgi:hypothetical protein
MKVYQKCYGNFERGFIGFTTLGVLGQSCLGSAAAMLVLMRGTSFAQMFQLFIIVSACMMFNGAVLAQQKPKMVFNLLIASVLLSLAVIIFNIAR